MEKIFTLPLITPLIPIKKIIAAYLPAACLLAAILLSLHGYSKTPNGYHHTLSATAPGHLPAIKHLNTHTALPLPDSASLWVFDKTIENVDLYHLITACEGKKVVFLKFNNRNNHKVKISWKEVFVTQMEKAREGFHGMKQLVLPPGETAQSGCSDTKVKECLIIPNQVSPAYPAEILKFEYKDINVSNP